MWLQTIDQNIAKPMWLRQGSYWNPRISTKNKAVPSFAGGAEWIASSPWWTWWCRLPTSINQHHPASTLLFAGFFLQNLSRWFKVLWWRMHRWNLVLGTRAMPHLGCLGDLGSENSAGTISDRRERSGSSGSSGSLLQIPPISTSWKWKVWHISLDCKAPWHTLARWHSRPLQASKVKN